MTIHKVPCGLCGHMISLAGARRDATYGWVCKDGKGCKRRRR
jgi:hypothetical protein